MAFRLPVSGGRAASGAALATAVFGVLLTAVAGCGGSSGLSGASPQQTLAGTYMLDGLSASGTKVSCPNTLTINSITVDACVAGETLTLNSNGTYVLSTPATALAAKYQEKGTFSRSGGKLTLTRTTSSSDTNNDGTFETTETTTLSPSQSLVSTITFDGSASFTITPIPSDSSSTYPISLSVDSTPVSLTYTRTP